MIEIKDVKKVYPGYGVALHNISLSIPEGQVVGLFGANGAGKSTLLRCIAGMSGLSGGEVVIDGDIPRRRCERIAYISEEGSFFTHMTVAQYGLFLEDFFPGFNAERYQTLIDFFGLSKNDRAGKLSRGQRSKLEISAGMSKNAKYILMDEPFLGKDIFTRRDFLRLMVSSLRTNETIIVATHLIDEVEQFIDRAIILRYGKVYADMMCEEMADAGETLEGLMERAAGYDREGYKRLLD